MTDWRMCLLTDIGTVVGGGTPSRERSEYWDGTIPWLTPGELSGTSGKFIVQTQDYITELGLANSGAKLVPGGSLLVTSRASIGFCTLAGRPMATNQGFKNLIPGDGVDPSYLFHSGQTLGREMKRRASGTTFSEISRHDFERIAVHVPPMPEQRRIAEILDTIDEAIHVTERVITKHSGVHAGLSASLFSGTSVMDKWPKCRLSDIGTVFGGGTPSREKAEYWNGSIPWLTPGELTGSLQKYVFETRDCITKLGLSESSARILPAETLLVTSRASIGSCVLAGRPMATNQGFKNLIPHEGVADPAFLLHLCRTLDSELLRRASGTTFREISGRDFGRIRVPLPPLDEQRRITRILDTVGDTIHANEIQRNKLRRLRAGLAVDLLSGSVRTVAV